MAPSCLPAARPRRAGRPAVAGFPRTGIFQRVLYSAVAQAFRPEGLSASNAAASQNAESGTPKGVSYSDGAQSDASALDLGPNPSHLFGQKRIEQGLWRRSKNKKAPTSVGALTMFLRALVYHNVKPCQAKYALRRCFLWKTCGY